MRDGEPLVTNGEKYYYYDIDSQHGFASNTSPENVDLLVQNSLPNQSSVYRTFDLHGMSRAYPNIDQSITLERRSFTRQIRTYVTNRIVGFADSFDDNPEGFALDFSKSEGALNLGDKNVKRAIRTARNFIVPGSPDRPFKLYGMNDKEKAGVLKLLSEMGVDLDSYMGDLPTSGKLNTAKGITIGSFVTESTENTEEGYFQDF